MLNNRDSKMAYLCFKGLLVESQEGHFECLKREQEQVTEASRGRSCCFETAALTDISKLPGV